MKATDTNIHLLLQGSKVFEIPPFQRQYSWTSRQWAPLWDDIWAEFRRTRRLNAQNPNWRNEYENIRGHFMGSIVLHPAPTAASTVTHFLVVDGQQRLTTIIAIIAALRDIRAHYEPDTFNADLYNNTYLYNVFFPTDLDRLIPTKPDVEDYKSTISGGEEAGGIGRAYRHFYDEIVRKIESGDLGVSELDLLGQVILTRLVLVEITTSSSDSVNHIFNTLNSKGLDLSATDLIRNELLFAVNASNQKSAYDNYWMPIQADMIRRNSRGEIDTSEADAYFLAQELLFPRSDYQTIAAKDLFAAFESRFRDSVINKSEDPSARAQLALEWMKRYCDEHDLYSYIRNPDTNLAAALKLPPSLARRINNLHIWGSSPSIPLTFAILRAYSLNEIDEADATKSLDVLLGYLVRRALCGIATNNLNRLLSPLASRLYNHASYADTLLSILSGPGYYWPTDAEVLDGTRTTPLYTRIKRNQVKFILASLEEHANQPEPVELSTLTIEHILPQTPSGDWTSFLSRWEESPEDLVNATHSLGNLTLTGINSTLSNHSFPEKRTSLATSNLALNTYFLDLTQWGPDEIRARSLTLARILTSIFEGPDSQIEQSQRSDREVQDAVIEVIDALPNDTRTSSEAIAGVIREDVDRVRQTVAQLAPIRRALVDTHSGSTKSLLDASVLESLLNATDEPQGDASESE